MELEELGTREGFSARNRLLLWVVVGALLVVAIGSLLVILPWLPAEDEVDKLIDQGKTRYARGDLAEARATFLKVIERDAKQGLAYNYIGVIAQQEKRFDEAEAYFKTGIEVDPLTSANHYNLSLLYFQLGRYDEAESEIREAMRLIAPKSQYLLLYADIAGKRKLGSAEIVRRLRMVVASAAEQARLLEAEQLANAPSLLHAWSRAGSKLLSMNDTRGVRAAAEQYLNDEKPHVREFAAKALQEMGGLEALLVVLDDDDVEVRRNAHAAMERLSGRPVPFDPEGPPEVRRRAAAALKGNLDRYRSNTEAP